MAPKKNYSPHQMGLALEAVRRGQSVSTSAKKYGVPRITLRNKATGISPAVCSMGPPTILSSNEENLISDWLFAMSEKHCQVGKEQLLNSVELIIKSDGRETPFIGNRPGRKWYQSFLKRHPEVSEQVAQNLVTSKKDVTEDQITGWFSEVGKYFNDNNLRNVIKDPKRVFNTDESAFFLNPNPGHVLATRGDKNIYPTSGNKKENLTVLLTANAAGQFAPPMIVFAYERIPKHISDSVPDKWGISKSENGWMCGSTFYEYVTNIFYPWLIENKVKLPIIFFLDNHASHLTKHLSDFCAENKIELIGLYPNSTHILKPMDVAVFRPLKLFWKKQARKWKPENLRKKVKKDNFAPILKRALQDITPDCIKSGFRTRGLFPFGSQYIDFTKLNVHNRRITAVDPLSSSKDREFFSKLENEIVKIFSQSKLDMYNRCFYLQKTVLNDELPTEDLTLYTIWAKYKHLYFSANLKNSANTKKKVYKEPDVQENELLLENVDHASESGVKIDTDKASQSLISISKYNNDEVENLNLNQGLIITAQETPSKNMSKEKTPSAITGKPRRVFHKTKDLVKKKKEKRKQVGLKKKMIRGEEKNTNNGSKKKPKGSQKKSAESKQAVRKRKRVSVTSSEATDSDTTYAETRASVDETKINEEIITIPDEPTEAKKRNLMTEEVGSSSADMGMQNMTLKQKVPFACEVNEKMHTKEQPIQTFLRNMGTEDFFLIVCEEDQETKIVQETINDKDIAEERKITE